MDKKEEVPGQEGGCCDSGGGCGSGGCGSGSRKCCSGKAALVLILLVIGGLIGYGMGRCGANKACKSGYMPPCPMGSSMGGAPMEHPSK